MKSIGRFLPSHTSSLVRGLLSIPGSSRVVRNIGSDLLSCRDIFTKFLSYGILKKLYLSNSYLISSKSRLVKVCSKFSVAADELYPFGYTNRVISDKVHCLLITLCYFRPDRFVQLLSLIPILILLLYLLVSLDLVLIGLCTSVQNENNCILSLIQIVLVLKLQVVSTLTIKGVVSLIEYDWLVFNT